MDCGSEIRKRFLTPQSLASSPPACSHQSPVGATRSSISSYTCHCFHREMYIPWSCPSAQPPQAASSAAGYTDGASPMAIPSSARLQRLRPRPYKHNEKPLISARRTAQTQRRKWLKKASLLYILHARLRQATRTWVLWKPCAGKALPRGGSKRTGNRAAPAPATPSSSRNSTTP